MTQELRDGRLAIALLPLAGFALLLASPGLDVRWEDHPAHFWLVVAGALAARRWPRPRARQPAAAATPA